MEEKKRRTVSLGNFTRNFNVLNKLIDDSSHDSLVTPQFEKVKACWEKFEAAHDTFMEAAEIDVTTDKDGLVFIDEPSERYQVALKRYSDYLKASKEVERTQIQTKSEEDQRVEEETRKRIALEKKEAEDLLRREELTVKFNSAKAEVSSSIDTFKRLSSRFKDTVVDISDSDKRSEWSKLDSEFQSLQKSINSLGAIDPTQDVTETNELFVTDAETLYLDLQRWVLTELKNSVTPVPVSSTSSSSSTTGSYTTKKEPVSLPSFKGEDKEDPYLRYPIWKEQWDVLILEYDVKWRSTMLTDKLDKEAREQFVGFESNYEEAMRRLHLYYADPLKVVSRVMEEVMSAAVIKEGDYKSLIRYCRILENNHNRLGNLKLEHEMSNKSTMSLILQKFPRLLAEKWTENLSSQSNDVKGKPFPHFVKWLSSQKEIWEGLVAAGFGKSKSSAAGDRSTTNAFFSDSQSEGPKCYKCGIAGHKKRECPTQKPVVEKKQQKAPKLKVKKHMCAFHKGDATKHCNSISCQDLRKMEDSAQRIQLLKDNGDCPHCCGDHKEVDCIRKTRVCGGGKDNRGCTETHNLHELFCVAAQVFHIHVNAASTTGNSKEGVVLLIMNVRSRRGYIASVFWDNGCSSNFVREAFAKMCGFRGREETLCVTTLGGVVTDYHKVITYTCSLRTLDGEWMEFEAYGMECITGSLSTIEPSVIRKLFPHLDEHTINNLKRASDVDLLMGMNQPSCSPERAEPAKSEEGDLFLYRCKFGVSVGGRHPLIREKTKKSNSLFVVNHTYHIDVSRHADKDVSHELEFCEKRNVGYFNSKIEEVQPVVAKPPAVADSPTISTLQISTPSIIPTSSTTVQLASTVAPSVLRPTAPVFQPKSLARFVSDLSDVQNDFSTSINSAVRAASNSAVTGCFAVKTAPLSSKDMFFQLESLGTFIEPQCGGCKCAKCPVPGSKFSFMEQKQFDTIKKNLTYDETARRWFTEYPWVTPRSALPRNDKQALQCLYAIEKRLSNDSKLASDFSEQIQAMVDSGRAVILSDEQVDSWEGDYYYLPLVAAKQKKKALRVCFDASRKQGGCPSMNMCQMKGPDRFINDLLSVVLAFRNGRVGCAADIIKFHNQVHLKEKDVHMQRFLWRGMDTTIKPQTYAVTVNNFGVTCANSIATIALHNSADEFSAIYPVESQEVKDQTYVDDGLTAAVDMNEAHVKTERWDEICAHAGMPNKGWTFSGDEAPDVELGTGGNDIVKVLGFCWIPRIDSFVFKVSLKLVVSGNEIDINTVSELESLADQVVLNRRCLLSNVKRIFDPAGLVAPFILPSKLLMRKTWSNNKDDPWDWDDDLPDDQRKDWLNFLQLLLRLNEFSIPRSLWPEGDVIGRPILVIFSDGSISAYGVAAYIRWQLVGGGYWSRLILSKSKISPKNIVSIPRMELCGAVAANRVKNFLVKETKYDFARIYHLVDSSTVLGYVHKECGLFGPYEGVRVAEIQSSNEFEDGRLKCWGWVAGSDNPADWTTKPRTATDIGNDFFYTGPVFFSGRRGELAYQTVIQNREVRGRD